MKLKNDIEAKIETWTFDQVVDYSSRLIISRKGKYQGFGLWSSEIRQEFIDYNDENYRDSKDLSPLEIQSERNLPNEAYNKALVALHDEKVIGIILCQWLKDEMPFWRFFLRFIDVHKDFRHKGVATGLIETLDKADFIKGKILEVNTYTKAGRRYSKKVIERTLKAEDYALILVDYHLPEAPTKFGKYNPRGVLK